MKSESLVTLGSFPDALQAHLVKTKLESEGIECFLLDESVTWLYPQALSGVKVQVYESDLERARDILDREESLLRPV